LSFALGFAIKGEIHEDESQQDKDGERGKDSGGRVFRRFMGDNWREDVLKHEERDGCFQCHARRKSADYVFSVY
jgi:hypothetical protein